MYTVDVINISFINLRLKIFLMNNISRYNRLRVKFVGQMW